MSEETSHLDAIDKLFQLCELVGSQRRAAGLTGYTREEINRFLNGKCAIHRRLEKLLDVCLECERLRTENSDLKRAVKRLEKGK